MARDWGFDRAQQTYGNALPSYLEAEELEALEEGLDEEDRRDTRFDHDDDDCHCHDELEEEPAVVLCIACGKPIPETHACYFGPDGQRHGNCGVYA